MLLLNELKWGLLRLWRIFGEKEQMQKLFNYSYLVNFNQSLLSPHIFSVGFFKD
jgi:hypothetical protein